MYIRTIREKKDKCKENIESIGPHTDYVSQGYGGHGDMEGYEETKEGNKNCTSYINIAIK